MLTCEQVFEGLPCRFQQKHRGQHLTFEDKFDSYGLPIDAELYYNTSIKDRVFGPKRRWFDSKELFKLSDLYKLNER